MYIITLVFFFTGKIVNKGFFSLFWDWCGNQLFWKYYFTQIFLRLTTNLIFQMDGYSLKPLIYDSRQILKIKRSFPTAPLIHIHFLSLLFFSFSFNVNPGISVIISVSLSLQLTISSQLPHLSTFCRNWQPLVAISNHPWQSCVKVGIDV